MISSVILQKLTKTLAAQVSLRALIQHSSVLFFCIQWIIITPVTASTGVNRAQSNIKEYGYEVVNVYPHDPEAFTQGLIFKDGYLYESTGLFGKSSLRKVELKTGVVLQKKSVDRKYFSEGLAANKNQLIQLTWKAGKGFIFSADFFDLKGSFDYSGEGWGLTYFDKQFIMSDGSSYLRFLDEHTMQENNQLQVLRDGQPVVNINELEMVRGNIYANIWLTDIIIIISPQSGHVIGQIDLTGLLEKPTHGPRGVVLNGIAYDVEGNRLFVTGKFWPKLFEIKLTPR